MILHFENSFEKLKGHNSRDLQFPYSRIWVSYLSTLVEHFLIPSHWITRLDFELVVVRLQSNCRRHLRQGCCFSPKAIVWELRLMQFSRNLNRWIKSISLLHWFNYWPINLILAILTLLAQLAMRRGRFAGSQWQWAASVATVWVKFVNYLREKTCLLVTNHAIFLFLFYSYESILLPQDSNLIEKVSYIKKCDKFVRFRLITLFWLEPPVCP